MLKIDTIHKFIVQPSNNTKYNDIAQFLLELLIVSEIAKLFSKFASLANQFVWMDVG